MYQRIKDGFAIVFVILFLILLLPIIIIALIYFGVDALWRWTFRKLRRDPPLELEQIVPGPESTETTIEFAKIYFDELIQRIASESGGKIDDLKTERSKWNSEDGGLFRSRSITLKKRVATQHASVFFELSIEEIDKNGERSFYSCDDGDDQSLAGNISVFMEMSQLPGKLFDLIISYDHEAAYFCIAILKGDGRYNQQTGQLWCYVATRKVWIVKYKPEASSSYGVRMSYGNGRAGEYWIDSSI